MQSLTVDTPTGPVTLTENQGALVAVTWGGQAAQHSALLDRAAEELRGYFDDPERGFTVPLHVRGSEFLRAVCAAMRAIPVGETRTYGEIARGLGAPAQAIGQAYGANPIPIVIPCHRVLGANGLGGFSGAGGVETKVALLRHERAAGLLI